MELIHSKIPVEFLTHLPEGIKFIHRHGNDFLVVEELLCPEGHSLMEENVRIHDEPSIKMKVKVEGQEGLIYVDSFWGSHAKLYNFIPRLSDLHPVVYASCPACGTDLMAKDRCNQKDCDSTDAILFHLPGGKNQIYVCARLGCPGHRLEVTELSDKIAQTISDINYFGTGVDDAFRGI